jgi:predicted transcriptional regulator
LEVGVSGQNPGVWCARDCDSTRSGLHVDELGIGAFRSQRTGLAKLLGPLEAELMEFVWASERAVTAREVEAGTGTSAQYVTVVTVLNNLTKKGVLRRERRGKVLIFQPARSRDDFLTSGSEQVLRGLIDLSPRIAVNSFVGALDALSTEALAELQAEVEAHVQERAEAEEGSDDAE